MRFYLSLFAFSYCAFLAPAHAARPMIADDARVTDAKACQLETWVKNTKNMTEYWALPACNFTGNLEVTLGATSRQINDAEHETDFILQGKTLFKKLETNSWGLGVVLGNIEHPLADKTKNTLGDFYMNIPTSISYWDDKFVLHVNAGLFYDREAAKTNKTWGLGSETQLEKNTWLIAEAYGKNQETAYYQLGLRHWLVENRLQIDAAYGNRLSSDEQWVNIGLRMLSVPFLP